MDIIEIFKALSDENRLRIINLLSKGELCVCEIEAVLEMTQSNVSRHLNKLKNAGIISYEKKSQWVYYRIDIKFIKENKLLYDYLINMLNNNPKCSKDTDNLKKHKKSKLTCKQLEGGFENEFK